MGGSFGMLSVQRLDPTLCLPLSCMLRPFQDSCPFWDGSDFMLSLDGKNTLKLLFKQLKYSSALLGIAKSHTFG